MNAYGMTGLAQGFTAGMQEVNRNMIQERDYQDRRADKVATQQTEAETARQQLEEHKLKFEKQQLELETLKSTIAKKDTYEAFGSFKSTGDTRYLNEALKNPDIKKTLPGIVRYDQINTVADKALMDPVGITESILKVDPKRYVKATNEDGTAHIVDMYNAYQATGYHRVMQQEDLDAMKTNSDISKQKVAIAKDTITGKALASGDPDTVMAALKLTDPDLWLKVKQGGSVHMDAYTQAMTAFTKGNPDATQQEIENFNSAFATKTVAGVGYVAENKNTADLSTNRESARTLFTPQGANKPLAEWKVEARTTQDDIISNMDEKEKTGVFEAQKTLETNHQTASMVEGLLKGDFKKVDKDVIANAKTWLLSNTGIENKQAINNINFNTQSGMLLAGLIKEMSGTAVADAEVARLMKNFLGGDFTDERYIKETMKSFSNYLRTKNNTLGKQYKDTIPYTVGTTTNLKPKSVKPVGGNQGSRSGPTSANLPPLVFPGKAQPQKTTGKPAASSFWKD